MTASQSAAREAFLKIREVMLEAGRPVTALELSERTGLPLQLVTRRLQSNGTGNMSPSFAWFVRGETGWGLTQRGRELT